MKTFNVSVEKRLYCTAIVQVKAKDSDHALKLVQDRISKGELSTTEVDWNDPEYEDDSFTTTGDVD